MKMYNLKVFWSIGFIFLMLSSACLSPVTLADKNNAVPSDIGFDKGLSYTNVVPIKKVTFIDYDDETYLDDFAYLAAVPTAVFNNNDKLYSHPVLFFQEGKNIEDDKERTLNAYQGIYYFMEDWMQYCNGNLDLMTLVNVEKNQIPSEWDANNLNIIKEEDPYSIARDIAINDWAYSDEAVVAVIEENFEKTDYIYEGFIEESISANNKIKKLDPFFTNQLDKLNPRPHDFEVPKEHYKYLSARTWWSSIWMGTPSKSDLPLSVNMTIPAADPDSQFYCQYENGQWMQVAFTQGWNIDGMDKERTQTYIYNLNRLYHLPIRFP